jgi:hypothetical protein
MADIQKALPSVFAQLGPDCTVTVMIGTKHYRRPNGEAIFIAAQEYRSNRTQEAHDTLLALLEPKSVVKSLFGGRFIEDGGGRVYLEGTTIPVPPYLVSRIAEARENGWDDTHLVNFWSNVLLNPYEDVRQDVFAYCEQFGVPITDLGYMVLYKAVTFKHKAKEKIDSDLPHFVGEAYQRVKKQKKGIHRFEVFYHKENDSYRFSESMVSMDGENHVGNLKDLWENIDNLSQKSETVYTDKWTKTMEIKLGVPVRKDHNQYHESRRRMCSEYGVHAGSYEYVKDYASADRDTVLMALINPKDLTVVHLNQAKLQTSQYIPIAVMEQMNKGRVGNYEFEEIETGYYETDYADYELKEIREKAASGELSENEVVVLRRREETLAEVTSETTMIYLESAQEIGDEL